MRTTIELAIFSAFVLLAESGCEQERRASIRASTQANDDGKTDSAEGGAAPGWSKITLAVYGLPEPIDCGAARTPLSYQLDGESIAVTRADIGLRGEIKNLRAQKQESDTFGYRFDLCVDDETGDVSLKRMLRRRLTVSAWETLHDLFVPDREMIDPAWGEALGEGGSQGLVVQFYNQADTRDSVLVRGWKSAKGNLFLTVSRFDANGDPLVITSDEVTFGRLVEGDPWAPPAYKANNRVIEVTHIKIELTYDVRYGQNNYKSYRVNEIRIADDQVQTPLMSAPFTADLKGKALDEALKINYTHHGLEDTFVITLPHAQYQIGKGGLTVTYRPELNIPAVAQNIGCHEVTQCGRPL